MKILTAAEIKNIENIAVTKLGISEIILMENAASALSEEITKRFDKHTNIAFLCGFGNNGGDGFAAARKLLALEFPVKVFYPKDMSKFSPASKINLEIYEKMGGQVGFIEDVESLPSYDVIVDALFGTGLKRPIEDNHFANIINITNKSSAFKIAVDIPSGLFADNVNPPKIVFKAHLTITFIAMKICLALYPSKSFCGEVILKNISVPENIIEINSYEYLTKGELPPLKIREKDCHKGDYGKSVIIGGSPEMPGAAVIAAKAALKIGSGLTYLYINSETDGNCQLNDPEIIIKKRNFQEPQPVIDFINLPKTATLIGNGMGTEKNTAEFVKEIVKNARNPLIIDADAINVLTISDLKLVSAPYVITPHLKEFARLLDVSVDDIKENRMSLAKNFAISNRAVLVLKSADTIIATPDGGVWVTDFGTPALAKGGSGDALAGIITGLVAQNYSLLHAALLAVFILGQSAKYAEIKGHTMTVTATEVIGNFQEALNDL